MEDRLKFRVWDEQNAAYMCTEDVMLDTDGDLCRIYEGDYGSTANVGQCLGGCFHAEFCTGLKDQNGKLIYGSDKIEGDLFDSRLPIMGKVVYDEEHGVWACKNDAGLTFLFKIDKKEVIGTIHDPKAMAVERIGQS